MSHYRLFDTKTIKRVIESIGLDIAIDLIQARCALSFTKPKMKNMLKTNKNYESFTETVSKKRTTSKHFIELAVLLDEYETAVSMEGLGGCEPEKFWDAFLDSYNSKKGLQGP